MISSRRLALCLCTLLVAGTTSARPPNVVFFLADDLGWTDTSVTGSTYYRTPHLERLAARGTIFRNAYAANPLCSPTRASLLTGRVPARLHLTTPNCHLPQVVLEGSLPGKGPAGQPVVTPSTVTRLSNDYVTFAEILKQAGYATAFMGKWHLGSAPYLPEQQGFDRVVGGRHHPGPPGGFFAPWTCDTLPKRPKGTHITDTLADEAEAWIKEQGDRPFLLCFWDYSVHAPFQAKQELIERYQPAADPANPHHNPVMAAMIQPLDDAVGRLLDVLEATGQAEHTLLVFSSDNGGNMYDDVNGLSATSNHPLRGGKANSEEGGSRVPLIVSWPGKVPEGEISDALFTSPDFFPTVMEVAGLPLPADTALDGVSQWSVWSGKKAQVRERVFGHFPHYTPATGNRPSSYVREGPWKLLRWYGEGPKGGILDQLFHVDDDPGELTDRADGHPMLVQDLGAKLDAHLAAVGAHLPQPNPAWKPEQARWVHAGTATHEIIDGVLKVTSSGGDPYVHTHLDGNGWRPKRVGMRIRGNGQGPLTVFWRTAKDPAFRRDRSATVPLQHNGAWKTVFVDVPFGQVWKSLRLDPGTGPGVMEIDDLQLLNPGGYVLQEWTFGDDE